MATDKTLKKLAGTASAVSDGRTWYVVDVKDKILGRSSSKVAFVLQGKHKPAYVGNKDMGDHVIILNASLVKLTGDKWTQRFHYHHSRYPGGIKKRSSKEVAELDPRKLLIQSIDGMLPRNSMRKSMMKRLHVYAGDTHPHQNVTPVVLKTPSAQKN